MLNRIRYVKTARDGLLASKNLLEVNKGAIKYRVFLDLNDKTYQVIDTLIDIPVATGEGRTLHILKKRVKVVLEQLGVQFTKEQRVKRPQQQEV